MMLNLFNRNSPDLSTLDGTYMLIHLIIGSNIIGPTSFYNAQMLKNCVATPFMAIGKG